MGHFFQGRLRDFQFNMNLFYLPQFPERFFHLDSGVTAVDFSAAHPNLLAVSSYLKLLF